MDLSCGHVDELTAMELTLSKPCRQVRGLQKLRGATRWSLREAKPDMPADRLEHVPCLALAAVGVFQFAGKRVVRMHLNGEWLATLDQLDEQREAFKLVQRADLTQG